MSEDDLKELIRLTKLASSFFNMQKYRAVVGRDKELCKHMCAATWDQAQVADANVLLILRANFTAHEADYKPYWCRVPQTAQEIHGPARKPLYEDKPQLTRDEGICSTASASMPLMLVAQGMW